MKKYKYIIFDLDGTLVDTLIDITNSYVLAAREFGFPEPTPELIRNWIGKGHNNAIFFYLDWAGYKLNRNTASELFIRFKKAHSDIYRTVNHQTCALYEDVRETLDALQAKHIPMALVTNKPDFLVESLLKELDIHKYFTFVIGAGVLSQCKPHPAPIYLAMANLGALASESLMVGDSENDVIAAKSANIDQYGVDYGYNHGMHIKESNPTYIFSSIKNILDYV